MRYDGQKIEAMIRSAAKRSPLLRTNLNRLNSAETPGTNCLDGNVHYLYGTIHLKVPHTTYDT